MIPRIIIESDDINAKYNMSEKLAGVIIRIILDNYENSRKLEAKE